MEVCPGKWRDIHHTGRRIWAYLVVLQFGMPKSCWDVICLPVSSCHPPMVLTSTHFVVLMSKVLMILSREVLLQFLWVCYSSSAFLLVELLSQPTVAFINTLTSGSLCILDDLFSEWFWSSLRIWGETWQTPFNLVCGYQSPWPGLDCIDQIARLTQPRLTEEILNEKCRHLYVWFYFIHIFFWHILNDIICNTYLA